MAYYQCYERLKCLADRIKLIPRQMINNAVYPKTNDAWNRFFESSNIRTLERMESDLKKILAAYAVNEAQVVNAARMPKRCPRCTTLKCAVIANHVNCVKAIVETGDHLSDWCPRAVLEDDLVYVTHHDRCDCLDYFLGRYHGETSRALVVSLVENAIIRHSHRCLRCSVRHERFSSSVPFQIVSDVIRKRCDPKILEVLLDWLSEQNDSLQMDIAQFVMSDYETSEMSYGSFSALSNVVMGLLNRGWKLDREEIRWLTNNSSSLDHLEDLYRKGLLMTPDLNVVPLELSCRVRAHSSPFDDRMIRFIIRNTHQSSKDLWVLVAGIVRKGRIHSKILRWELFVRGFSVDTSDLARARGKMDRNLERFLRKARTQNLNAIMPIPEALQDCVMSRLSKLELRDLLVVACDKDRPLHIGKRTVVDMALRPEVLCT